MVMAINYKQSHELSTQIRVKKTRISNLRDLTLAPLSLSIRFRLLLVSKQRIKRDQVLLIIIKCIFFIHRLPFPVLQICSA
jgi:hypothetical protein